MDRRSPLDLERKTLRTQFRGYRKDDVDALVAKATDEINALSERSEAQAEQIAALTKEMEVHRGMETFLKDALILAQKTAEEVRSNALAEAAAIVDEARQKALEVHQEAEAKLSDLRWETERLKLDRQKFLTSFKAMLEAQLRELNEALSGQFAVVEPDPGPGAVEA